jgi:copper(I)-binding protein
MRQAVPRRDVLKAGLGLFALYASPGAGACEFHTSNLRVNHPWTRATAAGATSAVVCMTIDEVTEADRLIGVETVVAEGAALGGAGAQARVDFSIPAGRESVLSESGTYVQLVGLRHPLEVGRSYPMTLIFEKGGYVLTSLNVDYGPA